MKYHITNKKNKYEFIKKFKNDEECYHWIVNHLDLSLEWVYERI